MGVGIWFEMFVANPTAYLFQNSDPIGSLKANVATAVVAGVWALLACDAGGRILVLIIAVGLVALGVAQFASGGRVEAPGRVGRTNTSRATADELSRALHHRSPE